MRTHTGEHHKEKCFKTCELLIGVAKMFKTLLNIKQNANAHRWTPQQKCFKTCELLIGVAKMLEKKRYKAKCERTPMNTTNKNFKTYELLIGFAKMLKVLDIKQTANAHRWTPQTNVLKHLNY